MDRRTAAVFLGAMALAGCGGGGDSAPADAGGAATASNTTSAQLSSNIAAWGDSLTAPFAPNLALLYPDRQVFNGGVAGETSGQIAARETSDRSHGTWINIFWYGHNNIDEPARIKADIAASIAALAPGNNRFVVMSLVNEATLDGARGSADYAAILQLNSELAALYPQNYLDIRSYLVGRFNPGSAQDLLDAQNDVPPASLRFDEIHLNNDGSIAVAQRVKQFIDAKGW